MTKQILTLLFVAIALSSCCTKKYCIEYSSMGIKFFGFSKSELDTIYTTGYTIGTQYNQVARIQQLDSAQYYSYDTSYYLLVPDSTAISGPHFQHGELSDQYDWVIYIPSVNKTVHINNYGYSTFSCNRCVFVKSDKIHSLSTCSVDGVTTYITQIKITK